MYPLRNNLKKFFLRKKEIKWCTAKSQLNVTPGSDREIKEQTNISYSQIMSMDTIKRLKRQPQKRENICQSYI